MKKISIVVPCYNEEKALPLFYDELKRIMDKMSNYIFELILVDDGSKDGTLDIIKNIALEDVSVKYISFSRNFGKESALYAGFKNSTGEYVAMMDADLQDPPSLLPEMVKALENEGFDSVATRRVTRKGEPLIRSFFARKFYKIMNSISETELVDGARDYRLMNRKFVNSLLSLNEYNRFTKGLFGWIGFKTKWIEYENVERIAGETKWSFFKLFKYAIEGIISFSTTLLSVITILGLLLTTIGILAVIACGISQLFGANINSAIYVILAIMVFNGLSIICIGVLGKYVSDIHKEVKKRPIYIVNETNIEE